MVKIILKTKHKGKGNVKAQRKRRKQRLKRLPPRWNNEVLLIDGNFSFYPVAYCLYHKAFMTHGLVDTHRCEQRNCPRLRKVTKHDEEEKNISS